MVESLNKKISQLDYFNLNVIEIKALLNDEFSTLEIQKELVSLNLSNNDNYQNSFGKCGIDPEVNPCGDADEY